MCITPTPQPVTRCCSISVDTILELVVDIVSVIMSVSELVYVSDTCVVHILDGVMDNVQLLVNYIVFVYICSNLILTNVAL